MYTATKKEMHFAIVFDQLFTRRALVPVSLPNNEGVARATSILGYLATCESGGNQGGFQMRCSICSSITRVQTNDTDAQTHIVWQRHSRLVRATLRLIGKDVHVGMSRKNYFKRASRRDWYHGKRPKHRKE